jgi:O-antigen ligase
VLLLFLLLAPFLFKTSFERFGELSSHKPLGQRGDLWAAAIDLIEDHPVGGVGIGNSIFSIGPYLTRFGYGSDADGIPIHNPILVVWSETGIVGAGLYVGVLLAALLSFSRCLIAAWPPEMLWLRGYCHIVFSVFVGYIASWIKGGSMETGASYFFIITLMLIPAVIARGLAQQEEP